MTRGMRAQLMPMTAAGDSFSKYAAVLFFMGACISWRAPGENVPINILCGSTPVPPASACPAQFKEKVQSCHAARHPEQAWHARLTAAAMPGGSPFFKDVCSLLGRLMAAERFIERSRVLPRRSGTNNSAIFSEIVPEQLRSAIYAFDRSFEGAVGATAAPLVGTPGWTVFSCLRP